MSQVETALFESFLNHQKAFKSVLDQIEGLNITTTDKFKYIKKFCETQTTDPTLPVKIIKDSVAGYPTFNHLGYYIGYIFFSFAGGVKKAFFLQVVELAKDVNNLKNIEGLPTSAEEAKK